MEFETQDIYDYGSYQSQINWMKCQNQSDWNQNVTEEMINSYSNMSNCHSDLGFYCSSPATQHFHQPVQNCHQQIQQCNQQQYDYYERTAYYEVCDTKENLIQLPQFQHHLNHHHHMSSLEGAATVQGQSINFQTSSLLDATQYLPLQMPMEDESQVETKKQRFYCTACNMRFSRLYHLKRHFESSGHKKNVADANMEDPAISLINFYKNNRDNMKYYGCQFCDKKYKNKFNLRRHMNTHNDLKNALWYQYNAMQNCVPNCNIFNC